MVTIATSGPGDFLLVGTAVVGSECAPWLLRRCSLSERMRSHCGGFGSIQPVLVSVTSVYDDDRPHTSSPRLLMRFVLTRNSSASFRHGRSLLCVLHGCISGAVFVADHLSWSQDDWHCWMLLGQNQGRSDIGTIMQGNLLAPTQITRVYI